MENQISKYDLSLYVTEYNNYIALDVEYSTSLFREETVQHILQSYINIINQVVNTEEEIYIKDIQNTTREEKDFLIDLGMHKANYNHIPYLKNMKRDYCVVILDQEDNLVPYNVSGRICLYNPSDLDILSKKNYEALIRTNYHGYWSVNNNLVMKDSLNSKSESTIEKARRKAKAAPKNSIEKKLIHIWKQIFNEDEIDIYDEYYRFGGSSLKLATQVCDEIIKEFGVQIAVKELFDKSTIHNISKLIGKYS